MPRKGKRVQFAAAMLRAKPTEIRCADCGFLGLRRGDGELIEADVEYRTTGSRDVPRVPQPPRPVYPRVNYQPPAGPAQSELVDEFVPRCFERADVDFKSRHAVMDELSLVEPPTVVAVMEESWLCASFTKWQPNRTPKEHREMIDRQWERSMVRTQVWISAGIGLLAVAVAAVGIVVGAQYNIRAAEIQRDAQPTIYVTVSPAGPTINVIFPTPVPLAPTSIAEPTPVP